MNPITVQTTINAPIEKIWEYWTKPEHIVNWAFAHESWEAPAAENDLRVGGKFKTTMAAKDKSESFDVIGTYTNVEEHKLIEYTMEDDRKVKVVFESLGNQTRVSETFDPFPDYTEEQERGGWQAILDNFKKYAEEKS